MINNKRKGCRAQGQVKQKAKLDCTSQIISQYDTVQLTPKGVVKPMAGEEAPLFLDMYTYNVRTLRTKNDVDRLIDEVDQIKWDVTGLCETYRKEEGCHKLKEDNGCMK